MFKKLSSYISDSIIELRKVRWLDLSQTVRMTTEVILFTLLFSIVFGVVDFIFLRLIFLKG